MTAPNWYMVNKLGMATLCSDKDGAEKEAADAQMAWPHMGPHRAVQLVEAADVEALRAALAKLGARPVEREPLTDEMVLAALRVMSPATFKHGLHPLEKDGPMIRQRMEIETKLVRKMLDAAHGIKGGQHGTE